MPMVGIGSYLGHEEVDMTGLISKLLNKRYGQPTVERLECLTEYRWNGATECLRCVFYDSLSWDTELCAEFGPLEAVYGTLGGGILLGGALKVSLLNGQSIFGLYSTKALQNQPEVKCANRRDPEICFFMDSANVWFYGVKGSQLYVYDAETDELDLLGPLEHELEELLKQWETPRA